MANLWSEVQDSEVFQKLSTWRCGQPGWLVLGKYCAQSRKVLGYDYGLHRDIH